eukprot:gene12026-8279_t
MVSNRKVLAVAGVTAGLAFTAAVLLVRKSRSANDHDQDDISFAAVPKLRVEAPEPADVTSEPVYEGDKPNQRETKAELPQSSSIPAVDDLDRLLDETIEETVSAGAESVVVPKSAVDEPLEIVSYPHYGVEMKIPAGWSAVEGPPAAPNIAIIQIMPPDTSDGTYILLSIEDISTEQLQKEEYIQLMKSTAMETMFLMTNGVQPMQRKDETVRVGAFTHLLEFIIAHPMMSLLSTNYLAMENGMTYNLQMIGSPEGVQHQALQVIAKNVVIQSVKSSSDRIEVNLKGISLTLDSLWSWKGMPQQQESKALGLFGVNSKLRSEDIALYNTGEEPEDFLSLPEEENVNGVRIGRSLEKEKKIISTGGYSICITSHKGASRIPESSIVQALRSVRPAQSDDCFAMFVRENRFRFKIAPGSAVLSSVLNPDTVMYHPKGMPQQQAPEEALSFPTAVIRMALEKECETLEEWRQQIEEDNPEATFGYEELCGYPCIKVESSEMIEIGMGQKMEARSNSLVFVVDGNSYLIRWELAKGEWKKYEKEFHRFVDGFEFI